MRYVVAGLVCLGLALLTSRRAPDWQSDLTIWTAAHDVSPAKPRPLLNMAAAYMVRNAPLDWARADLYTALGQRAAVKRTGWEYRNGLGIALAHRGLIQIHAGARSVGLALIARGVALSPTVQPLCEQLGCQ